jgi:hypothetical protein
MMVIQKYKFFSKLQNLISQQKTFLKNTFNIHLENTLKLYANVCGFL